MPYPIKATCELGDKGVPCGGKTVEARKGQGTCNGVVNFEQVSAVSFFSYISNNTSQCENVGSFSRIFY